MHNIEKVGSGNVGKMQENRNVLVSGAAARTGTEK